MNGTEYVGGTLTNNQLSFWIGNKISSASDNVVIYAYDKMGAS
ncbi:immunoglobulin-like domain-containing protein [Listeria fleischmannii]|nr:immunoglobulin-like domain-containing protein [Listeria fleischmannii]